MFWYKYSSSSYEQIVREAESLTSVLQLFSVKEHSEFKPIKHHLYIDLVSHSPRVEKLGKYT